MFRRSSSTMIGSDQALPGRTQPMVVSDQHCVLGHPLMGPWPTGLESAVFGLGCFWGAEQLYWRVPGVYSTAVGYAAGYTPNPTYDEVCSARTGHAEVVLVVFDPEQVSYDELLAVFWESHDPTQGLRQGNDVGSQYRSVILTTTPEQRGAAEASIEQMSPVFAGAGLGAITTEIADLGMFFYAESSHQQYLDKNPHGYCPIHATGVRCNAS